MTAKKEIIYNIDAYKKILSGMTKTLSAIIGSFGPNGGLVAIEKGKDRSPQLTNDGITIANSIILDCPFENIGCQILKDIGDSINEKVGDGTTTAMILAGEIFIKSMKYIISSDVNRVNMINGVKKSFNYMFDEVEKYKKDCKFSDIEKIAFISSKNKEISILLSKAYEKIGKNGLITTGESNGVDSCLDIQSGAEYDIKVESMNLMDSPLETKLDNPYILVTDEKIDTLRKIIPILEKVIQSKRRILIISESCSQEVLNMFGLNKSKGGLSVITCKINTAVPSREMHDLAVLTGGVFLDKNLGFNFREIDLDILGSADIVKIKKDKLTIINGHYNDEEFNYKIKELKEMINDAPSSFDREKANERLSRMTGGVAVVRLGAHTESELKEKKMRFEDALSAVQSSMNGGVVKGGCGVYLSLFKKLNSLNTEDFTLDEKFSHDIILSSIEALYGALIKNSNLKSDIIFNEALDKDDDIVYDLYDKNFVNFEEAGIIESYIGVITVLNQVLSINSVLLNIDAIIAEVNKK